MRHARFSRRPSAALVIALLALVAALGGVGYAATKVAKNSVGAKQIKDGSVTGREVADRSLDPKDFGAGELDAGEPGPQGPVGAQGAAVVGPGTGAFRDAEVSITSTTPATPTPIATLTGLGQGVWAISAKTVVDHDPGQTVTCRLLAPAAGGGDVDTATSFNAGVTNTVSLQVLHAVPAGGQDVRVACSKDNGFAASASFTKIQAMRLTSATNLAVGG
jgi:hypothetical protein